MPARGEASAKSTGVADRGMALENPGECTRLEAPGGAWAATIGVPDECTIVEPEDDARGEDIDMANGATLTEDPGEYSAQQALSEFAPETDDIGSLESVGDDTPATDTTAADGAVAVWILGENSVQGVQSRFAPAAADIVTAIECPGECVLLEQAWGVARGAPVEGPGEKLVLEAAPSGCIGIATRSATVESPGACTLGVVEPRDAGIATENWHARSDGASLLGLSVGGPAATGTRIPALGAERARLQPSK